jgi:hypothetical protein
MPAIDQVPLLATVVEWALVEFVPSLTTNEIPAPASPVPLTLVLDALALLTGFVTVEMATAGATVSLVDVLVVTDVVVVSVAVYVIVPSDKPLTLIPAIDQLPPDTTVVVVALVLWVPSLATTEMVSPGVPVPVMDVPAALDRLIGLVTVEIATVVEAVKVNAWASCTPSALSSACAIRLMVPVNPLTGVRVTVAVLLRPGVTSTVTLFGVAVKLLVPVTLNVGVPPAESVPVSWKLTA